MTITYCYKDNLYVNLTNRCPNRCEFCLRTTGDKVGDSDSLWLEREPTVEEIWQSISERDLSQYRQLVFCGYGEPTYRLEDLLEIAKRVKAVSNIPIRINTNGLSDLIHKKDTTPLFQNIDSVSVSLNASTPEKYDELCHSIYGLEALPAILRFTKKCKTICPPRSHDGGRHHEQRRIGGLPQIVCGNRRRILRSPLHTKLARPGKSIKKNPLV